MSDGPPPAAVVSPSAIARVKIPPERLDEVERRLLRCEAPADFVPVLAKAWGRHKRKVWGYVARVRARLAERAKLHDPQADAEQIRAMIGEAYAMAREDRDAKGMNAAARTLADVTGVAAPRRFEHSGPGGAPLKIFLPDEG